MSKIQFNLITKSLSAVAILFALFAAVPARATSLWNVDLVGGPTATMSGAAVVGSAGDFWNTAETTDVGNNLAIKNSTGVSGPGNITLNFAAPGGNLFGFTAEATANPLALMDGFGTSVNNGSGTNAAPLTFTFSGLVPNSPYTVYAYGASKTGTDRGTFFFQTIGGGVLGATSGASTDITTGPGIAYTTFSISTNASGAFTILTNFHSQTSAQAPVNGFQILGATPSVPEPASISLLAAGGLLVLIARKRSAIRG